MIVHHVPTINVYACVSQTDQEEVNLSEVIRDSTFKYAIKSILGIDDSQTDPKAVKSFHGAARPRLDNSILAIMMVIFPSLQLFLHMVRKSWEDF